VTIEIKRIGPDQEKKISGEMAHKKAAQEETGYGHQLLSSNGRTEVMINSSRHHTKISLH
jgi:hypothetical protein